jgi:hypothetical protein
MVMIFNITIHITIIHILINKIKHKIIIIY